MKKFLGLLVLVPSLVNAQPLPPPTATPGSFISWEITKDALVTTAVTAQGLKWMVHQEGPAVPQILVNVICQEITQPPSFTCKAPIPTYMPGLHDIVITGETQVDPTTRSENSNVLRFNYVVVVSTPTNLRIGGTTTPSTTTLKKQENDEELNEHIKQLSRKWELEAKSNESRLTVLKKKKN